jgi:hypothetical protein
MEPSTAAASLSVASKLIYLVGDKIALFRGRSRKKASLEKQYTSLAAKLMSSEYFLGEEFSWGDRQLALIARGELVVGEPRRLIAATTSHHLEHMVRQTEKELALL